MPFFPMFIDLKDKPVLIVGGGTVALYVAGLNVDVVDLGVPILSMHSPFEVASKMDIYHTYKAFLAFYK